jgi:hypothetical protein
MPDYAQLFFLSLILAATFGALMFQVISYLQAARFERATDDHLVGIVKAQEDDVRRAESLYRGALDDIQLLTHCLESHEAANDMASGVCDDLMDENMLLRGKVMGLSVEVEMLTMEREKRDRIAAQGLLCQGLAGKLSGILHLPESRLPMHRPAVAKCTKDLKDALKAFKVLNMERGAKIAGAPTDS